MHKYTVIMLAAGLSACVNIEPLPPVPLPDDRPAAADRPGGAEPEPSYPRSEAQPDTPQQRVAIATPESVSRPPQLKQRSAAARLRSQARAAIAEGDNDKAIRYLERALRIAPREAQTYYDFANVRLHQQRPEEALQLARRGLELHPDLSLRNDLEQLVQLSNERLRR